VDKTEQELYGHRVVVAPDDADPPSAAKVVITVGDRRFGARLDSEIGWSCAAMPFRGHASPMELAERLAASLGAEEEG
jgi:hypothetical protein